MTEERSHRFIHEAELADRYVAGRMSAPERVAFEDHFITCAECQRDVRFASVIRASVAASGAAGPRRVAAEAPRVAAIASRAGRRRSAWWTGAVIAAGLAAIAIVRAVPSRAVTALGAVDAAPAYSGIEVRSAPGRGEAMFESAMNDYAAGHYAAANQSLRNALAAGEDSIPTEFFIGATSLLSGDATSAAAAFGKVVAKGDSPYRDEAQWYEAKALLRLGRGADALAALAAQVPDDPAMAARLAALADSVRRTDTR